MKISPQSLEQIQLLILYHRVRALYAAVLVFGEVVFIFILYIYIFFLNYLFICLFIVILFIYSILFYFIYLFIFGLGSAVIILLVNTCSTAL